MSSERFLESRLTPPLRVPDPDLYLASGPQNPPVCRSNGAVIGGGSVSKRSHGVNDKQAGARGSAGS